MIFELVGLPGSGKTTLAQSLTSESYVVVTVNKRIQLLINTFIFWFRFPRKTLVLFSSILLEAPAGMKYTILVNGFLVYSAKYIEALRLSKKGLNAILDQGHMQLIISLPGAGLRLLPLFPLPDVLVMVDAPRNIREERMEERGRRPRSENGEAEYEKWNRDAEISLFEARQALEKLPLRVIEYDGTHAPTKAIASLFPKSSIANNGSGATGYFLKKTLYAATLLLRNILRFFGVGEAEVTVLMYHSIDDSGWKLSVNPKEFELQIQYLVSHKEVVPLASVVEHAKRTVPLKSDCVAITFDDGYADLLRTVLPIIQKHNVPITVFLPTDDNAATDPHATQRLTWKEIEELATSELVSIGSHGITHRKLPELSPDEQYSELLGSGNRIESVLGFFPSYFAYPFGSRSPDTEKMVRSSGYKAAFAITEGLIGTGDDLYRLKRVQVDSTMSPFLFRARLTRAVVFYRTIVDCLRKSKIWKQ